MEKDPDILAIARAALKEFPSGAAEIMEQRARDHEQAGEVDGAIFWHRMAMAVAQLHEGMNSDFG